MESEGRYRHDCITGDNNALRIRGACVRFKSQNSFCLAQTGQVTVFCNIVFAVPGHSDGKQISDLKIGGTIRNRKIQMIPGIGRADLGIRQAIAAWRNDRERPAVCRRGDAFKLVNAGLRF